ncbi:MAG: hypothetical protein CMM67_03950 [Rhodospirillaceae bacterium]|nr:hypothetical protein [Rhodospirillaceae bacterium]OUT79490.1 MAG: hypothetical protein CBB83_04135 [Rhodospirillaceae bacterium TMED23]|tara:strand:+ start:13 stop:201 length:189 start_codon:yes stop_codon:yes gene_type:complete
MFKRFISFIINKIEKRNKNMIAVGEKAPLFSFTNQDGKSVTLSDFSNKFVLMWWYPRAGTPG